MDRKPTFGISLQEARKRGLLIDEKDLKIGIQRDGLVTLIFLREPGPGGMANDQGEPVRTFNYFVSFSELLNIIADHQRALERSVEDSPDEAAAAPEPTGSKEDLKARLAARTPEERAFITRRLIKVIFAPDERKREASEIDAMTDEEVTAYLTEAGVDVDELPRLLNERLATIRAKYAGDEPPVKLSRIGKLYGDDRPGDGNSGLCSGGFFHLERHGFREGDTVRITLERADPGEQGKPF